MNTLTTIIPDVDVLLKLAPEELAETLLSLAHEHRQQMGLIHPQTLLQHHYPRPRPLSARNRPQDAQTTPGAQTPANETNLETLREVSPVSNYGTDMLVTSMTRKIL